MVIHYFFAAFSQEEVDVDPDLTLSPRYLGSTAAFYPERLQQGVPSNLPSS